MGMQNALAGNANMGNMMNNYSNMMVNSAFNPLLQMGNTLGNNANAYIGRLGNATTG